MEFINQDYANSLLQDSDIIIAATNDKNLNKKIANFANKEKKLVNIVDDPQNSDFIFGANIKIHDLILSISSSGSSPTLARILKNNLSKNLPQNLDLLINFLSKNKNLVRQKITNIQKRRIFWQEIIEGQIGQEIIIGNLQKAQNLLEEKLQNNSNKNSGAIYFIGAGPGDLAYHHQSN